MRGSHVGSDVAADLLAVAMDEAEEPVILIDVGTNTEIVMGTKDRLLSASCPAGPAFEGGQVGRVEVDQKGSSIPEMSMSDIMLGDVISQKMRDISKRSEDRIKERDRDDRMRRNR